MTKEYIKPNGVRLTDDRFICCGRTEDWKLVLMTLYERAYSTPGGRPYAAVLKPGQAKFSERHVRRLIQDVSDRLEIERLVWLDS